MVLTILMMQIIQCFPPFSMNDSNKNSVLLTLQNPLLPRIHCKKVYFGSVFVFARRLDTFIFTTAKCIIRFLTRSRLDIIIFKCDVLAIALLLPPSFLPSFLPCAFRQNLDKNQNLDIQINSFLIKISF